MFHKHVGPDFERKKHYSEELQSKEAYYQGSDRFFLTTIMANYGPVQGVFSITYTIWF